jgi:hypothetical protein
VPAVANNPEAAKHFRNQQHDVAEQQAIAM